MSVFPILTFDFHETLTSDVVDFEHLGPGLNVLAFSVLFCFWNKLSKLFPDICLDLPEDSPHTAGKRRCIRVLALRL